MKNKRLLQQFSFIDEQYVKEAEPKMKSSSVSPMKKLGRVACFVLIAALSLYLFIPFSTKGPNLTAYQGSEYFPIIERISDYRYKPSPYKNNFQYLSAEIGDFFDSFYKTDGNFAPGAGGAAGNPEDSANGSNGKYEETTDNQVDGVIEADLVKRTDKYIFRLGFSTFGVPKLKVYSIDKENSAAVASFDLPGFADEKSSRYYENQMYLSEDGNTVTVISPYYDENYDSRIRIISIDVSDLGNINIKKTLSIDGYYNSSRMVDGKLLFISEYTVKGGDIDYTNPETFVPSVTDGEETYPIRFEDIIYPEKIASTRYSVVALIDEESLELKKSYALLDFYNDIYVSESNVYVTKEYSIKETLSDDGTYRTITMTDILVLGYEGDTLENKGTITTEGTVLDQYSMDEYENHFRVVTSTSRNVISHTNFGNDEWININENVSLLRNFRSANLTVFSLETLEKVGAVKDFAPNGESVQSVRFDGNAAYVCTAVVQTFTDPVFFFDLSDYSNITYTDTGVIDGFSSSLIQLGDGALLGIGREDWSTNKVEVYEERYGEVVSVDVYKFSGEYSSNYKGYFIDRENNFFGFAIMDLYEEYGDRYTVSDVYVLLYFNGYELVELTRVELAKEQYPDRIRAFIDDEYLYIIGDYKLSVVNIFE